MKIKVLHLNIDKKTEDDHIGTVLRRLSGVQKENQVLSCFSLPVYQFTKGK